MAQVLFTPFPTVQPRETAPGDYLNVQASPRSFGAQVGAGLEQLGHGAEQAGTFYNQVAADDQANKTLEGIDKLIYGDPNDPNTPGLLTLRGEDAQKAYPQIVSQMQRLRDDARNNLATPRAQLEFDQQTRYLFRRALSEAGSHYDREMRVWAGGVNKASANLALNGVARSAATGDQAAVDAHTQDLISARIKEAQTTLGTNLSPEMMQSIERGARAESLTQQIDILAPHDAGKAETLLNQAHDSGLLMGPEYDRLYGKVKTLSVDQQALFLSGAGGPSAQIGPAPHNNPGNIRPVGASSGFVNYASMQDGYNAISHNLDAYANRGINTLAGVITRWAPPNENPTASLISTASRFTGFAPTQPIDIRDPATKEKLIQAIVRQEQGKDADAGMAHAAAFMAPLTEEHAQARLPTDSNVPGLSSRIESIVNSDAPADVKLKAMAIARERYSAAWTDQTRAYEERERAIRQASDDAESRVIADVYSEHPQITAQQIAADPKLALTPTARMRMLSFAAQGANPKVNVAASQHETMNLLNNMRAPTGDPSRITDLTPVIDAYTQGRLTREDFTFLQRQFTDMRSPAGEKLAQEEQKFVELMKSSITKSNPLMGSLDPSGDRKFYEFNWMVNHQASAYREAGKNPFDLFNPSKPDYLGKTEALRPYQTSLQDSMRHVTEKLGAPSSTPAPAARPSVLPRQPGESMDDWVKRMGLALPGTH